MTPSRAARSGLALAVAGALAAAPPATAQGDPAGPLPPALAQAVAALLQPGTLPGAAVVTVAADGRVQAGYFGHADAARSRPVDAGTCWRVGSLTKTFTALLALRTEQRAPGFLDRPLGPAPAGCARDATPRELLEHTSGLAGSRYADYAESWPDAPPAEAARRAAARPRLACPGLHHAYANPGYSRVAAALEAHWRAPLDAVMAREVFAPLGMRSATLATGALPACLAQSVDARGRPVPPWRLADRAAGALVITATDAAPLARLLRDGQMPAPGGAPWPQAALRDMAYGRTGLGARAAGVPAPYGLGLFRFVAAGRLFDGHWGFIDGFQASFGLHRESGRAFFIVANGADTGAMGRLREQVAAHVVAGLPAPAAPAPAGRIEAGWSGWYANASHNMPLRARLWTLLDVRHLQVAPDGLGATLTGLGAPRPLVAQGAQALRDAGLPVATVALARDAQGRRHLVDGESYLRTPLALGALRGAAALFGLLASAAAVLAGIAWLFRRPAGSPAPWFAAAGGSLLALCGGFAVAGLLGGPAGAAALGRPGLASGALAVLSLAVPAATLAGAWRARARRRWWPIAAGLAGAVGLQAWLGWLPLVTW
ncbi:MAG: serine hydrolase domain-containing protein [Roseateles sp.]|uniref:serine hydrolase domain-containing protein n=1 Tax=Roseateles sp. TaxID=1971397 RepID=UPI0039EB99D6